MFSKKNPSVFIKATKEQVFSVITDYDSYSEWAADCIHSQVLLREGEIVVAEFLSPELMGEKYQLEFVHTPPTSVIYKQIDQHGSRGLSGSLDITESEDGQGVILTGEMRLKTSLWKKRTNRKRTDMILLRRLESVREDISYTYASEDDVELGEDIELVDRKKIIEVARRGKDIDVWFLGEKYELKKISRG